MNRNTVVRYSRLLGDHARRLHDELVAFSPSDREVQLDEKWSYVYKKQAHCDPADPADDNRGDWWDHTAYDPEHRLVLCVVPGARGAEEAEAVVADVKERTEGRTLRLMTSDDYPAYETAIERVYGADVTTTPSGRPSRRMVPEKAVPPELTYATVEKQQAARPCGGDPGAPDLRDDGGAGEGPGAVAGEPSGQRVVPGAVQRDRPAQERAEGAEDVHVLEGLASARVDDLFYDVQL